MQNKEPQSKLYVIYHDPCLDGIYSLTGLVLPILVKIRKDNWTIQQYLELLKSELSKISKEIQKPQEYKQEIIYQDEPIENQNMGFFYPTIQDLCYMPIRLSEDSNEVQKIIKFLNDDSKSSILIIVDYFGRTWDNLLLLTKRFQYVIVIDHHQTCVNAIPDFKIEKYQVLNKVSGIDNLFMLVSIDKAACLLVQDFHEQIFQTKYTSLLPPNIGTKFTLFTKYISDNDLFVLQYPETEPLQMAIMRRRLQFDVRQNPAIFYKLLEFDFDFLVKEGKQLAVQRNKKVENLVKNRKTVVFGKDAVGYALYCDDLSIMNPLGNALGILAMRSGDQNLGAVYHDDKSNSTQYKIHLRSAHHDENGVLLNRFRCDVLAESFGGGGHVGAASLYMKKKEWKKLMFE
ncbi:unnamed protein product [Paramecium pentaurelia]|uniref:DHHA1 domain-containing protein n=1 Tax=Paramecium pentaurelia TaxID=43138 RepID=A0A8S1UB89_9CILI|nr:unnamed protein product [Paramecium pentaurelia]